MNRRNKFDSFASMLVPGVVLWRAGHFSNRGESFEPAHIGFAKTEKNNWMGRMLLHENFMWEPLLFPPVCEDGRIRTKGFVVFLDKEPQQNWTHAVITGVSSALRNPVQIGEDERPKWGGAVFARLAEPYTMFDYRRFRQRMFCFYAANMKNPQDNEQVVKEAAAITPTDPPRSDEKRLFSFYDFREGGHYYAHA